MNIRLKSSIVPCFCAALIATAGHAQGPREIVLKTIKSVMPGGAAGKGGTLTLTGEGGMDKSRQAVWAYEGGGGDKGTAILFPGSRVIAATFGSGAAAIAIYKRDTEGRNIEAVWGLCGDPSAKVAPYKLTRGKDASEYVIENGGGKLLLEMGEGRTAKATWELPSGTYHGLAVADGDYLAAVSIVEGAKAGIVIITADNDKGIARDRWTMSGANGAGEEELTLVSIDGKAVPAAPAAGSSGMEDVVRGLAAALRGNKAALLKLKPADAQIAAITATADDAKALAAYAEKVFANIPESGVDGKPGQTKILVTTPDNLPGGYAKHAAHLKQGIQIYGFEFVEPGKTAGMAFDGLVLVDGAWIMIPKMWRAFE
ncbi:MAG: hypothetical protein K1X78_22160 [Verrucomicrobiaceae bacterium]|nr:hypothetical protein [Verrucomicrobiaceae bacterium]